jgi:ADP-heptose:LPS heptosyltransferase
MSRQPRQLVLAAGSLGDSLLTLPGLRALQALGPVTVAGTPSFLNLGAELFGVELILPLDPLLQNLLKEESSSPDSRAFFKSFGQVFLFFKDRDEKLIQIISQLTGKTPLVPLQPFDDFLKAARWAGEYWLETALQGQVQPDHPFLQSKLMIQDHHRERGKQLMTKMGLAFPLVIHPGSGSRSKNAPLSFFQRAAQKAVQESGKQVLVLWGEAEQAWLGEIQAAFRGMKGTTVLETPFPLKDLACLLTQASAYLGNDSGVTHLASACGARTFAVFNSTDSRNWSPQNDIFILQWLQGNLG